MLVAKPGFSLVAGVLLLLGAIPALPGKAAEASKVIIGFHEFPGAAHQELIDSLAGQISHVYTLIPAIAATVPEDALGALQNHPLVAYIEEDAEVTSIDTSYLSMSSPPLDLSAASTEDEYERSWGVRRIGSRSPHAQGITGKEVKIAIIDSGIDYNHEDLDGNYRGGYDFVFDDDDPMDDSFVSHGTNIAGIIAAEKNGIGVVGVAPDASLYALKVLTSFGNADISDVIAALQWAVDNEMDIANISIEGTHSETLKAACDAAYEAGLLIIAAAGNSSGEAVRYPASYDSVVAVTNIDKENNVASSAAIGSEIELSAPGESIYSTARTNSTGYGKLSGTSQAAPHVTGAAALVLSSGTLEDINGDGERDNKDLRLLLQTAVDDLGATGKDELFGFGLVDLEKIFSIHLQRTEPWLSGWQTYNMENKNYSISIQNNSLYAVIVWVSENGVIRRDLSSIHTFRDHRQPPPQQAEFEINALGTSFEVIFIPFGKVGSSADITIN